MRSRRRRLALAAALVAAGILAAALAVLAVAAPAEPQSRITVFAASSLTDVLPRIDPSPRYSFAGSDTLAAQIRQGAPADVFASANMALPRQLAAQGLCSAPVAFTRNRLVLIVPRANPAGIRRVDDLRRPGTKLVVADDGVPVGSYTRKALRNMRLSGALANVVSNETNVREVLAKVALGEADAGFVYSTDAKTVAGKVRVIPLPARARADARYGICLTGGGGGNPGARAFVRKVVGTVGQAKLAAAGFVPVSRG